jgi:hypothetical protein
MAGEGCGGDVVHAGAFQVAVGDVEAGRLDDIDGKAEAGGKAQDRAGVARNIRLIERYSEVCHDRCHLVCFCGNTVLQL